MLLTSPVRVSANGGTLTKVQVIGGPGRSVKGTLNAARSEWKASRLLFPDSVYRVDAEATNAAGERVTRTQTFSTVRAPKVLAADITPSEGDSVGVAMPIAVKFNEPVKDRAAVERVLQVTTTKPIEGAWHWLNPKEVHYRPRTYWPAQSKVTLTANLRNVSASADTWGTTNLRRTFSITNSVVTKVDLTTHEAKTYIDGRLARTIPVTGGKPGWDTRNGIKVILDKEENKLFTNEMIGAAESYRLYSKWALRVTLSGEFLHTASWSTGSQGNANVSHGCVGMNTENSAWLWKVSHVGDPVEVKSPTGGPMELTNGYGDWNLTWEEWKAGSALS
ncbi:L,D-transpeptidase [Actinopolymorpha alba]|uniref:L,D-transpeptidase n=1 Tax=Actinopolymorpha alba TaxID=533267 RepID=UPI00037D5752|nr:Ig-like domain-containing protein [Actinopolymorpha alba]